MVAILFPSKKGDKSREAPLLWSYFSSVEIVDIQSEAVVR